VTTQVPQYDSNQQLNDHKVPRRSLCGHMFMNNSFIAEATIQKQNINERHLLWCYSHFKLLCWLSWKTISKLHDRFTMGLKVYCPKIHL